MKLPSAPVLTTAGNVLRRHLRSRALLALVVLTPILLFALYQIRRGQTIHVGVLTDDKPYVLGMHDPERADFGAYRWTMAESSVRLPGLGHGPYRVTIWLAGGVNPHPAVTVAVNGTTVTTLNPSAGLAEYTVDLPASATSDGDLILTLQTATFRPPGDQRDLGVVLHRVVVTPTGAPGLLLPPERIALLLWALVLLAYLLAAIAGFGPRDAALVGGVVALGMAGLTLVNRPWLTIWVYTGGLPRAALYALVLTALLRPGLLALCRWAGIDPGRRDLRWPVLLAGLAFVAHFGGDLHPHTRVVDLGFHANRYIDVNDRAAWVLRVESREWGTRETIYPATGYLFMRLLRPLMPDVRGTIMLFMALSEAIRLCLVYLVARKATMSAVSSALAAAIFVIVPMAYLPFSWGIATNVFGAFWLTALFALLVLAYDRLRQPISAALFVISATLALLSHPGEFVLTAATLGLALPLFGLALRPRFRATWPLLATLVLAAGLIAFVALYRLVAVEMLTKGGETLGQKLGGAGGAAGWRVGGAIDDPIIGVSGRRVTTVPTLLLGGLVGYWREAVGYYYLWPPLAALVGLWWMRGTAVLERLRLSSILWWIVAVLFALVGLLLNVYVRYAYYLLPVIAIGAGFTLGRLWRRGRWVQVAMLLLLAATTALGLWFWYLRISVDGH